jgi:hypothetical protein
MNLVLRASWAFAGLVLSLPAFLPPVAYAAAGFGIAVLSGSTPTGFLAALWRQPAGSALLSVAVMFCVYWLCAGFLVAQFVLRKKLSLVPLAIVAVLMASTLVATRPWHATSVPFTLGPFALLHVVFMLTIAWQSSRTTTTLAEDPASP